MSEQATSGLMTNSIVDPEVSRKTVVDKTMANPDTPDTDKVPTTPVTGTNWEKRYGDLKSHYDHKVNEFKKEIEELRAQAVRGKTTYTPPKSLEELEAFKQQNPDIYEVVESVAHIRANKELEAVRKELESLTQQRDKVSREAAFAELKRYHPDFEEIRSDPAFHAWVDDQPTEIKSWLYERADARLAARALDLYKSEMKRSSDKQGKSLDDADRVRTKGAVDTSGPDDVKIWTQAEIARMSIKEYEQRREEIDNAYLQGRVRAK